MTKEKKSKSDKLSDRPSEKLTGDDPDERHPNPDDPYEEMGPPIKEMPNTGNPQRK